MTQSDITIERLADVGAGDSKRSVCRPCITIQACEFNSISSRIFDCCYNLTCNILVSYFVVSSLCKCCIVSIFYY